MLWTVGVYNEMLTVIGSFILLASVIGVTILLSIKRNMMLQQKIMVYVVLPIFFILSGILGYGNWQAGQDDVIKVKHEIRQHANIYAQQINAQLREISQVADVTANILSRSNQFSEQQYYDILQKNIAKQPFIYGAAIAFEPGIFEGRERFSPYVFKQKGKISFIDIAFSYDYRAPDMEWYVKPRDLKKGIWTEPYFDEGAGNIYMVTYAAPIIRSGKVVGVTTVDVDLSGLQSFADLTHVNSQYFQILSQTGRIVFSPDLNMLGKPFRDSKGLLPDEFERVSAVLSHRKSGLLTMTTLDDKCVWIAYAPITDPNWLFSLHFSQDNALENVIHKAHSQWLFLIFALLISLLISFFFIARLVKPLNRLSKAIKALSAGDMDVKIDCQRSDELGQLSSSFQRMAKNLIDREKDLQRLNEDLERRVQERTDELRNSEENLNLIFERMPIPISITRLSDGSVLRCNSSMNDFHHVSKDEDISHYKTSEAYVYPEQQQDVLKKLSIEGHIDAYEVQLKRLKTGEARDCLLSIYPIHYFEDQAILSCMIDITARKEAEQSLLIAKENAEKATRFKSEFLANMSHEIRTPMNAIIGLGQLLLMTDVTAKQRDYLVKIDHAALSLLSIINDILDFSKIEAGKLDMEYVHFDLNHVLNHVSDLTAMKAADKGLEYLIAAKPNLNTYLMGDPLRLGQILINLTSNAVKFTDTGEITIRIDEKIIDAQHIQLTFAVSDTGVGMSEEQRGKMFHAFSQADGSTTRKYGGTGLGLSISKRLVDLMGGSIWLESELGVGSTFYFTAIFGQGERRTNTRQIIPEVLSGMRVLIVDDNATSCDILDGFIQAFGFQSTVVHSGEEALACLYQATEQPYQLVLMDWNMPKMNGIETVRRIKQDKRLSTMPAVIMVSAYGREEIKHEALQEGLDGYLVKPINQSTLFDSIMEVFGESKGTPISTSSPTLQVAEHVLGAHLLLVEDNDINQQVAIELLENLGLHVTLAKHGQEGVDAVKREKFDGVLMDVQMPVMDGFEATRIIRQDEQYKDLPIIAMTANAMKGDRDACIAAGMNDHIAKPIDLNDVVMVLNQWITAAEPQKPQRIKHGEDVAIDIPELTHIDVSEGLQRMNGNRRLYVKILHDFKENYTQSSQNIQDAWAAGDFKTAERLAHTIKGVAGNIGASRLQQSATTLEAAIVKCNADTGNEIVQDYITDFSQALAEVMDSLQALKPDVEVPSVHNDAAQCVSVAEQLQALETLLPCLKRRKPKDTKQVMETLLAMHWDEACHAHLKTLQQLSKRYKFTEAEAELRAMILILTKDEEQTSDRE